MALGNGNMLPSSAEPGRNVFTFAQHKCMPSRSWALSTCVWHALSVLDAQHVGVVCLLGPGHPEANKDLLSLSGSSELSGGNERNLMGEQKPWEVRASCQSQLPEEEKRAGAGLLEEAISALSFVV